MQNRTPLHTVARALALALALITLGACASSPRPAEPPYATLVVENDSPLTVNVYTLRSGQRMRLGQVSGLRTEEFGLRRSVLGAGGDLRLLIDPVGSSRNYPSQSITVFEGDVVELQVSNFIR
ncbi:MAG: hypothetical protein P8177_05970 [Gemmatimonadota bacterium]|jgi:hypothetical protein